MFDTVTMPAAFTDESEASYSKLAVQLTADINSGALAGNQRLKVRDLAARYGVSPSPVREALQILQGQGLVEIDANKGARVRQLDPEGINQVCEMTQALESFAARSLAMSASPHHIRVLTEIDQRHRQGYEAGNIDQVNDAGREFHFAIFKFIRNPFVMRAAILHNIMLGTYRRQVGFSQERLDAICDEHTGILKAIAGHDSDLAGRLAYEHAKSCTDDLVDRVTHARRGGT